ncbi:MAG: hypothetical protein CMI20_03345 [Opitutae bacterium]|nr:hypothetical protein [Opitutae bacterium]
MSYPLISCIIPYFNSELYITDCLKSIADIAYQSMEIILVDDCSTDKSSELVNQFINNHKKDNLEFIHIRNDSNKGISYSKNQGMDVMNGEFFFFTGSDDIVLPNRISEPLSYLQINQNVDIVYSDIEIWHESKGKKTKRGFPAEMSNENAFLFQLKRSYFWSGVLFARNKVKLNFDENLSSAVDYDWYFNQFFKGRNIHFIDPALVSYRMHSNNTSKNLTKSKGNVDRILHKYDFQKAYHQFLQNGDIKKCEVNLSFAWYYLSLGELDQSLDLLSLDSSNSIERLFLKGLIYVAYQDYDHAAKYFESILQKSNTMPECLNNFALCKVFNLNDIQGAKELLRKALQGNPNYLDAKMNLQILENALFDPSHLKFTDKPLRNTLTHIENYC